MHHYVAFLRGINLGNRRIKMEQLRALFEALKFQEVSTFIASGNVLFASKMADARDVENSIQRHLEKSLGYAVDTFVRTRAELAAVAAFQPFSKVDLEDSANTVHVGFLKEPLGSAAQRGLLACGTEVDEFSVEGREYYWLCRIKTNESKVWTSPSMKAVKLPSATMRNLTMIRKMAALFPAAKTS